jgi:gas vesicle structural protein
MSVDRLSPGTSVIDVLDHVLDKGIVIDAWVRVSLVGIDLITVEARVVVASIDTYVARATAVAQIEPSASPAMMPARRRPTLEDQLRRVREQMDVHDIPPHHLRRSEDRLRDERHDSQATTITTTSRRLSRPTRRPRL